MIESPGLCVDEVQAFAKTKLHSSESLTSLDETIRKKTDDFFRGLSSSMYYTRISWKRKLHFITELVDRIHSLGTITILLNTLHSATGKITTYGLANPGPPIIYDSVLNDHDRMLDPKVLQEIIGADLNWFDGLNDSQQVAFLVSLVRFSGGAMVRLFYDCLEQTYHRRIHLLAKLSTSQKSSLVVPQSQETVPAVEEEHDPDDPKHQKVLELQKKWKETIADMRKDIEKRMPKKEEDKKPKSDKSNKSKKKGKKSKSSKSKKKKKKKEEEQMDWVQLMPIWIVKRIFANLDKKTLEKAKKVNAYWKWAINELSKDRKVRKNLDKANRKLKAATGGDCTLPEDADLERAKPKFSCLQKRLRRLEQRGAILEKMRHKRVKVSDGFAAVVDAVELSGLAPHSEYLKMYPRVLRSNSPIYKPPEYLVKDLDLICENREDLSDSECDLTKSFPHASKTTLGSDEDLEIQ